jgi:bifunctional non-homologous end joining protein LigD
MAASVRARFIEPMLLLRSDRLPDGAQWMYELKLDGYRTIAVKSGGKILLRSRNDKDFATKYPAIRAALAALPEETVVDGEVVAIDESGKPSFHALQNNGSSKASLFYYVFDLLILAGRDLTNEPLSVRRQLLDRDVLPNLDDPIRESAILDASLPALIHAVKAQGLEGLVAKRKDSRYESGQRSGAWQKMRVNQGRGFVIAGYTRAAHAFDALIFGYYEDGQLVYVARTRNGFTPSSRERLLQHFKGLEISQCPFVNLPESRSGRWGQGLTAEKMEGCVWLKPVLVGQFEFLEWTPDGHLRHAKFIALREDKNPRDVIRES